MLDLDDWPDLRSLHHRASRPALSREWVQATTALWTKARDHCSATTKDKILSSPYPPGQLKRRRQTEDTEGDDTAHLQRKKRRLRYAVTSSRLSEPFATPSTFVASSTSVREDIWARQRVAGCTMLRKVAILNLIAKKKRNRKKEAFTKRSAVWTATTKAQRAVATDTTRAASPLPLTQTHRSLYSPQASTFSEHDVLDYDSDSSEDEDSEDEVGEDEDDDDDEEDDEECKDARSSKSPVHSDFSKLHDYLPDAETPMQEYAFDSTCSLGDDEIYTFDPGGKVAMGYVSETERNEEVSYAPRVH